MLTCCRSTIPTLHQLRFQVAVPSCTMTRLLVKTQRLEAREMASTTWPSSYFSLSQSHSTLSLYEMSIKSHVRPASLRSTRQNGCELNTSKLSVSTSSEAIAGRSKAPQATHPSSSNGQWLRLFIHGSISRSRRGQGVE